MFHMVDYTVVVDDDPRDRIVVVVVVVRQPHLVLLDGMCCWIYGWWNHDCCGCYS